MSYNDDGGFGEKSKAENMTEIEAMAAVEDSKIRPKPVVTGKKYPSNRVNLVIWKNLFSLFFIIS